MFWQLNFVLIEIELIICIKMDLALNNLQRLICHKTQPINQLSSNAGALENAEYPFIAIDPRFTLPRVVAPDQVLSMDQIRLFDI